MGTTPMHSCKHSNEIDLEERAEERSKYQCCVHGLLSLSLRAYILSSSKRQRSVALKEARVQESYSTPQRRRISCQAYKESSSVKG